MFARGVGVVDRFSPVEKWAIQLSDGGKREMGGTAGVVCCDVECVIDALPICVDTIGDGTMIGGGKTFS